MWVAHRAPKLAHWEECTNTAPAEGSGPSLSVRMDSGNFHCLAGLEAPHPSPPPTPAETSSVPRKRWRGQMPAQPRRAAHQIGAIFSPSLQRLTSAEQWWPAWGTHLREHVLAGSQGDDGESAPKLQGREVAVLGSTWSSSWVSGPGGKVASASLRAWV